MVNAREGMAMHSGLDLDFMEKPFDEWTETLVGKGGRVYEIRCVAPHPDLAPATGFPVVFIPDADVLFGGPRDFIRTAPIDGAIPPSVIVGIGYGAKTMMERGVRREWDFSLPVDDSLHTEFERALPGERGGADEFVEFISTDVRRLVNSRVNINSARQALIGHSLGGTFTLTTLIRGGAGFSGFGVCSPAVYRDGAHARNLALDFTPPAELEAFVYMAVGEFEDFRDQGATKGFVSNFAQIATHLVAHRTPSFQVKTEILLGERHSTVYPLFARRALGYILNHFAQKAPPVDEEHVAPPSDL